MAKQSEFIPKPNNAVATILRSIISPLRQFIHLQSASGVVLLAVTVLALIWANSPYYNLYSQLLHMPLGFQFGSFSMFKSLEHWVNDGLMVVFFFVVGLEIKKEFFIGELADRKRAMLPILGALGGMMVPAIIYTSFNHGLPTANGWGIPMATDIAFAVGVLTLLGKRVPFALTVFLLALAIVDDLGAVLVIAFFYTSHLSWGYLLMAAVVMAIIYMFNIGGVRPRLVYFVLGALLWYAILKSGVHATIAGVLLGFLTPIRPLINEDDLRSAGFSLLKEAKPEQIAELRTVAHESMSPADAWIHALHPWVSFGIMPLFALCNAGVRFENFQINEFIAAPVSLGIFLGLFIGKPLGIFGFSWLGCKLGLCNKSAEVKWVQLFGVGAIGGIGFTMALFVGHLSLTDPGSIDFAKLAIMLASLVSALLGSAILVIKRS